MTFVYDGPTPLVPLPEVAEALGEDIDKTRQMVLDAVDMHVADIGIWMFRGHEYVEVDELIEILLARGNTYGDSVMSRFVE